MGLKKSTETDLVRQCLEYLAMLSVPAWRVNTTGVRRTAKDGRQFWAFAGTRGMADIAGVLPPSGRALWVEAKVRPNKPTAEQTQFLDAVNQVGGLGVVVYSLDELIAALAKEDI